MGGGGGDMTSCTHSSSCRDSKSTLTTAAAAKETQSCEASDASVHPGPFCLSRAVRSGEVRVQRPVLKLLSKGMTREGGGDGGGGVDRHHRLRRTNRLDVVTRRRWEDVSPPVTHRLLTAEFHLVPFHSNLFCGRQLP